MIRQTTLLTLLAGCALILTGCSSEPTATDPAATTGTSNSKASEPTSSGPAPGPVASLVKCGGCGTEYAAEELQDHDGMKMCAQCIAAHNH